MKKIILIGFSWENISSKNLPQKNKTTHTFHTPETQYSNQSQLKAKKKARHTEKHLHQSLPFWDQKEKRKLALPVNHRSLPQRDNKESAVQRKWRIGADGRTIGRQCFGWNSHNIHLFVKIWTANYVMEANFRVIYLQFHAQMEKPQLFIMKEIELLQDF